MAETTREIEATFARLQEGARPHMAIRDTWILGTPDQAAARLRELEAAGVGRVMFSVDHDLHRDMVTLVGERIIPLVNGTA